MDTLETYVKMCEKAEEIQTNPPFNDLDLFWIEEIRDSDALYYERGLHWIGEPIWFCYDDVGTIDKDDFYPRYNIINQDTHPFLKWVWLPRQDQLQEMIPKPLDELIDAFWYFATLSGFFYEVGRMDSSKWEREQTREKYVKQFTSQEQLWLAFVMKEKYNKVWDGEQWIT